VLPEFVGQDAHEADDGVLARRVVRVEAEAFASGSRAGEDDRAAGALRHHDRGGDPTGTEHTVLVDVDHVQVGLIRHLQERGMRPDARIGHDDVEPTKLRGRARHELGELGGGTDVDLVEDDPAAGRLDQGGRSPRPGSRSP